MKVFYRQPDSAPPQTGLGRIGVAQCYFKQLSLESDYQYAKHLHHHTGFELHIVTEGCQIYEVEGSSHRLECGSFLLVAPETLHRAVSTAPHTVKYAASFVASVPLCGDCLTGYVPPRIKDDLRFIADEAARSTELSPLLIENCVFEVLVTLLRAAGLSEAPRREPTEEHPTLALAKRYIHTHIEQSLTVSDVAHGCYLSEKQLTRIFARYEDMSPGDYIKRHRAAHIETLLRDRSLSLKAISERMNFSSEYYFNAFFKRFAGMPPGEYRRMIEP